MTPIPFTRLTRVEAAKLVDTRSGRWLVGLSFLALVLVMVVAVVAPGSTDQDPSEFVQAAGFSAGVLLPVVAILLVTTEWTQRTALVTFVQEPRRLRVLAAKAAAALALGLVVAVACLVLSHLALALSSALGHDVSWSPTAPYLGLVAYLLAQVLLGVGFGALVQHSAGAIVALFLAPIAVAAITAIPGLDGASEWVDQTAFTRFLDGTSDGNWGKIGTAALLWIVLPLGLGALRTVRREVA